MQNLSGGVELKIGGTRISQPPRSPRQDVGYKDIVRGTPQILISFRSTNTIYEHEHAFFSISLSQRRLA